MSSVASKGKAGKTMSVSHVAAIQDASGQRGTTLTAKTLPGGMVELALQSTNGLVHVWVHDLIRLVRHLELDLAEEATADAPTGAVAKTDAPAE